uniref:Latent-transforming growth factor beta-binding protein 1 n=1 Tax=Pelusios castaneus TaxID=367368 RepID=A0A8C8SY70_9SAUR
MQSPTLAALGLLLAALHLLGAPGPGEAAGSQMLSPAPRAQPPRPGRPQPPSPEEKRRRFLARRGERASKTASPHVCGEACCPGWSLAPKTQKCTKAICTPRCRNGGLCREPQVCTCRPGFAGHHCEQAVTPATSLGLLSGPSPHPISTPGLPPTAGNISRKAASVHWQPLTLAELQAVLRRRAAGPTDKMASLLAKHLEIQQSKTARPSAPPSTRPPRPVLCPLLCQNGGVCIRKDQCLCPPGFTGKFCHIPAARTLPEALGPKQNGDGLEGPQPLTKSVYTLPLANHQQERDGALSMVSVHVRHPPNASVTIHQVERVSDPGALGGDPANALPPARSALYSVLAQSSPRVNGYSESAGYGYCFQQLHAGECSAPLPGLRTQDICCRGAGVAWGVHECLPCPTKPANTPGLREQEVQCPKGFQRLNGSCQDVDECQEGGFCQNGLCTNVPGSFACLCQTGYILDSSRSSCISHHVISEAKGPCYRVLREGSCSLPTLRNITRQICCCSRVGKAWGWDCERCPLFGSSGFKEICPAGPGYHYSASDLRYNTRFLGLDLPRVPVGRQQGERLPITPAPSALPTTPRWSAQPMAPGGQHPVQPPPTQPAAPKTGQERPTSEPSSACERSPQICGPGRCVPRQGGYTCLCHPGFWLNPQGTHCIDVDECRQSPRPCANGRCENSVGSYRCVCSPGFRADSPGTECRDIDECIQSPRLCVQGRCENMPGSYRCICPTGYQPGPPGTGCTDIDECAQSPRPCAQGHCENTPGSYRCVCPRGFHISPAGTQCLDVDECQQSPPPCEPGRCENVAGGYRCLCPSGFRTSPLGTTCIDVDECRQTPRPCTYGRCENTAGGYQCVCPTGFRVNPQQTQCEDIDECENHLACPGQECANTAGSFQCLPCQDGYRLQHGRCTDINECLEGEYCFPHGECLNTDGSYTCLCAQGFATTPDGASCLDVDECQRGGVCEGGHCTNTDGSFDCYCRAGFRASPNKASCQDVDECQEYGDALCGTRRCENQPGSYRCTTACEPGYRAGVGGVCADVDECQEYGGALCGARRCENLLGSYRCLTVCEPGYRATASEDCVDVDECANETQCGDHAVCHNLPGSFQCLCDQGYESARDGRHCQDVNECETLQGVCGAELCENVEGSFLCICPSSSEEFDPMTGRCSHPPGPAQPSFPGRLPAPRPEPSAPVADANRQECYYEACDKVLARNTTRQECCCTLGHAWGMDCRAQPCPHPGTADHQALCPGGSGYAVTGSLAALTDVDECALFNTQLCRGGVCVNKAPGYSCYCPNGYYYETHHLECIDNDECRDEEAEPCVGGGCVNTIGSFYCACTPPLVLDGSQRRCVTNDSQALDENQAVCWQEVGPDLVCSRPRLDRQVTYTECCCLYGEAWGMDCALCPARDSDDFEALCNVLRPPSYGPARPGLGLPYEYGPEFIPPYSSPYGPELFASSAARGPPPGLRPDYDPYALGGVGGYTGSRDSPYSAPAYPAYEAADFEDLTYVDARPEEPRVPYRRPEPPRTYRPRSPPPNAEQPLSGPTWQYPSHDASPFPEQPARASETHAERFEGLQAEECGILNGCENGRCVRVPEGYTCDCHEGYRLDTAHMACLDIDECAEAPPALCLPGRCLNTDGSYRCLCPHGYILARSPHSCIPTRSRA